MISALLLIGMFFGLVGAMLFAVYAMLSKKWHLLRRIATFSLVALVLYFGALFGVSMASFQKEVRLREEYCIYDFCFSATDVQTSKTIGSAGQQSTAKGMYYIVRVKIRSDAKRVIQKLRPGSVSLVVVDDKGNKYTYSDEGQKALDAVEKNQMLELPWFASLGPGESSEREIVFDLPVDSHNPQLELTEGQWPSYLVIGDQNSFFHKKTRIMLTGNNR
jgi:hypothetical protein